MQLLVWIPLALPKVSPYRNGEFSLYRKLYATEIKVDYSIPVLKLSCCSQLKAKCICQTFDCLVVGIHTVVGMLDADEKCVVVACAIFNLFFFFSYRGERPLKDSYVPIVHNTRSIVASEQVRDVSIVAASQYQAVFYLL